MNWKNLLVCLAESITFQWINFGLLYIENSERATTLDGTELTKRKSFIDKTRDEIKSMTEQLTKGNNIFKKVDYTINFGSQQLPKQTKYYRLINEPDSSANTKQVFDDDESHKSPYVPNHSM